MHDKVIEDLHSEAQATKEATSGIVLGERRPPPVATAARPYALPSDCARTHVSGGDARASTSHAGKDRLVSGAQPHEKPHQTAPAPAGPLAAGLQDEGGKRGWGDSFGTAMGRGVGEGEVSAVRRCTELFSAGACAAVGALRAMRVVTCSAGVPAGPTRDLT